MPLNIRIVTTLVAPAGLSEIVEAGQPDAFAATDIIRHFASMPSAGRDPNLDATRSIRVCSEPSCGAQPPSSLHNPKPFNLEVAFEFGSDRLTASVQRNLVEFATALNGLSLTDRRVFIDGHTDARSGERLLNQPENRWIAPDGARLWEDHADDL